MRVELGQEVFSRDGRKIGNADHLVVNAENKHIEQLVVNKGFFAADKLIDTDLVDQVGPDGITLSLAADQVDQLPDFVQTQYIRPRPEELATLPYAVPAGYTAGGIWFAPLPGSIYDPAPINPPIVETETNIPEQDVVIGEGTDVIGADGNKVGRVDQVLTDAGGQTRGFVVRAGFLFHHDIEVPMDWVDEVGGDRIILNVTADEAGR